MAKHGSLSRTSLSERIIRRQLLLAGFLSDHVSLSPQIEMMAAGPRGRGSSVSVGKETMVGNGASPAGSGAGSPRPVLQFLTKLRRHASLEGASPYLKIKKWKLDSSQRASSLDTRGKGSFIICFMSNIYFRLISKICADAVWECRNSFSVLL